MKPRKGKNNGQAVVNGLSRSQGLFTPALLAEIDAAGAGMKAGNFRTQEQIDATLAATKARWLAAIPG